MPNYPQPVIQLKIADALGVKQAGLHAFRMAGLACVADAPVSYLRSFEEAAPLAGLFALPVPVEPGICLSSHSIQGWLANEERQVVNRVYDDFHVLEVAGIGTFSVARDSGHVTCRRLEAGLPRKDFEETLLGPPLAFALAIHGAWCLHASGVVRDGRASLFLGASGSGKSTLAAWIDQRRGSDVMRVTDDITPCAAVENHAAVRPHFPQFKLGESQYAADQPGELQLNAIFVLKPAGQGEQARLEPLSPAQALKALASQTVAVKLFDRELHWRHLQFLGDVVKTTKVFGLKYPHSYNKLETVWDLIGDHL